MALAACFAPDVQDGSFACGPGRTECPPGYGCGCDQRCWRDPGSIQCVLSDAPPAADARPLADGPLADGPFAQPDGPLGQPDAPPLADASPTAPDARPAPDAVVCGDGYCEYGAGENCVTCEPDCGPCHSCALVCDTAVAGDNCINCPIKCGACSCNGVCDVGDCTRCPADCSGGCVL